MHQSPAEGLRIEILAGANVGERIVGLDERHYGRLRQAAMDWLTQVEIGSALIDHMHRTFSDGIRQRLQIARNLVTNLRAAQKSKHTFTTAGAADLLRLVDARQPRLGRSDAPQFSRLL